MRTGEQQQDGKTTTIRVSLTVTTGERGWLRWVLPWLVSLSAASGVLGFAVPRDPACSGVGHDGLVAQGVVSVACSAEPAVPKGVRAGG